MKIEIHNGHIETRPATPPESTCTLEEFARDNEASADEVKALEKDLRTRGYVWLGGGAGGHYTVMRALIPIADLAPKQQEILAKLRRGAESTFVDKAGVRWGNTYIDNACPAGLYPRAFAGHLSALEAAGYYESQTEPEFNGAWGLVRLDD